MISSKELARHLRLAGWDRATLLPINDAHIYRLLIREATSAPIVSGPHRQVSVPGEESVLKLALADRPALSDLIPRLFQEAASHFVIAAVPTGAYWLNNKGLAAYLSRIPDAAAVTRMLRRTGLTDRFQGGFLIQAREFQTVIPALASQPFCGGPDVHFASSNKRLLVTACHEFDLHLEMTDPELAVRLENLARSEGIIVKGPADVANDVENWWPAVGVTIQGEDQSA